MMTGKTGKEMREERESGHQRAGEETRQSHDRLHRLMLADQTQVERVLALLRILWDLESGLHRASSLMRRRLQVNGRERLLLKVLERHSGIQAQGLARFLGLPEPTIAPVLARLERRGLAERIGPPSRSRLGAFWRLTPAGDALTKKSADTIEQAVRRALLTLPADSVESGTGLLLVIASSIRKMTSRGDPLTERGPRLASRSLRGRRKSHAGTQDLARPG